MAISREQVQQIIGDGLVELAQQGVLDIGEITSIVNAISNPLIETFEAQAGLSGLPVRTFTKFNPLSDIVANVKHKVSAPLWTDIAGKGFATELTSFFTNSGTDTFTITDKIPAGPSLSDTMPHYINVYDENPDNAATTASAEPNFAIAFGQRLGYGARNNSDSSYEFQYPTRAVYAQYRGLLIGYNDNAFTFGGTDRDDIYVININRARIKEKLDPGNWELRLGGSEQTIRLIDDSGQGLSAIGTANKPLAGGGGRVFNIVSGTIDLSDDDPNFGVPVEAAASRTTYGLAYPDQGIIVLDAVAVSESIGKVADGGTSTEVLYSAANGDTDKTDNNLMNFYRAIQTGSFFRARSEEEVTSTHYFCRIQNKDYNFSNNPTYYTASDGSFTNAAFFKDPKAYITTVGMYNDNNELLAVAKLSKPLLKSFSKEAVIKVKLDF